MQCPEIQVGNLKLDMLLRHLWFEGKEIDLTSRECAILEYLMTSPGQVLSRAEIIQHVWIYERPEDHNILEDYIKRIR